MRSLVLVATLITLVSLEASPALAQEASDPGPTPAPPAATEGWSWRATPPPPPSIPAFNRPQKDEGKGLRIAGWAMLGAGYLVSAWVGAVIYIVNDDVEKSADDDNVDRDEAWYLFIPIGGSLAYGISRGREIATKDYLEGVGRFVGIILTIPTLIQSAGFCLAIAGHSMGKKKDREDDGPLLAAAPVGPGGSIGFSMSGSF